VRALLVDWQRMGLYKSVFRFDGPLPDLREVEREALRRLGNIKGIEARFVESNDVVARSVFDPFTHPVVCAILEELGGQPVSLSDGRPVAAEIPPWALRRIREMPWRDRMAVRFHWWAWLLGTAKPRRQ
jgi:hypothetical protein